MKLIDVVRSAADEVIADYGAFRVEIEEGFDHDGEPALFVGICYAREDVPVPPATCDCRAGFATLSWPAAKSASPMSDIDWAVRPRADVRQLRARA